MPEPDAEIEALIVEVKRLRRALRKIAECSDPGSVEWVIAQEALGD